MWWVVRWMRRMVNGRMRGRMGAACRRRLAIVILVSILVALELLSLLGLGLLFLLISLIGAVELYVRVAE